MIRIFRKIGAGLKSTARRMRSVSGAISVAIGAALLSAPTMAADFEVRDAWAQPLAPGTGGGAVEVYFTLVNKGRMGFLVGVEAEDGLAEFCTLSGSVATGVARNCGQIDRIMLAGDDSFVFDRRGIYVQLSELDQSPAADDTKSVRLLFADGTAVPITAPLADRDT